MDRVIPNFGQGLPNVMPVTGTGTVLVNKDRSLTNGTWYLDIKGDGVWDGGIVDRVIPNFGQGLPMYACYRRLGRSGKQGRSLYQWHWYLDIKATAFGMVEPWIK